MLPIARYFAQVVLILSGIEIFTRISTGISTASGVAVQIFSGVERPNRENS